MGTMKRAIFASLGLALLAGAPETVRAQDNSVGISTEAMTTTTLICQIVDDQGRAISNQKVRYYIVLPPIPGAVSKYGNPVHPPARQGKLETNLDGEITLPDIGSADQVLLTVNRDGFAQHSELVDPPYLRKEIRLKKPFTKLHGIVRNVDTQDPIPNATVTVTPVREMKWGTPDKPDIRDMVGERIVMVANERGEFATDLLPPGKLQLDAMTKDGMRLVPQTDGVYLSLMLAADTPLSTPDVMLYKGYTLTGIVRDAVTSEPIQGAKLEFPGAGQMLGGSIETPVVSDKDGRYSMSGLTVYPLKEGGFTFSRVSASAPGYKPDFQRPGLKSFDKNDLIVHQDFSLSKEPL